MRMVAAALLTILWPAYGQAQTPDRPHAVSLFSNVERGPAFMLECVNPSRVAVNAIQVIQQTALRVDGQLHERTGGIAGSFLGDVPSFGPGQHWTMMIGLRQDSTGTKSADFGAVLRSPWTLSLAPGRHVIEFRCQGLWTDATEFFWESATVPG